jgi:hypothetical protein
MPTTIRFVAFGLALSIRDLRHIVHEPKERGITEGDRAIDTGTMATKFGRDGCSRQPKRWVARLVALELVALP